MEGSIKKSKGIDMLRRAGDKEHKWNDLNHQSSALRGLGTLQNGVKQPDNGGSLVAMNRGDRMKQRDGIKVFVSSVHVKGFVHRPLVDNSLFAPQGESNIFIALVLDTQTNGQLMNSEDVFVNSSGADLHVGNPFIKLEAQPRYKILATESFSMRHPHALILDSQTPALFFAGESTRQFDMFATVNLEVTLDGGGTNISIHRDNSLQLIAFSTIDNVDQIGYNSRVRFYG